MNQQTIFTCDRCGERFHEVSYDNESRTALTVDFHWDEVSTGHHLKTRSYDLIGKGAFFNCVQCLLSTK